MAHNLMPIIHVGKAGITDNIIKQADEALTPHELIKGTVQQNAPVTAKEAMEKIMQGTGAMPVSSSGRKFVIYRPNPDEPVIKL